MATALFPIPLSPRASPTGPTRGVWRGLVPRTIRWRLALTYVGLILIVMSALGAYLVVMTRALYTDRLADQLEAQARLISEVVAPQLAAGEGIDGIDPVVKRLGSRTKARLTVIGAGGVVLGDSTVDPTTMENHATRSEIVAALAEGTGRTERHSGTIGIEALYVAVPIRTTPGAVARVSLPLAEVDRAIGRVQRDVIAAAVIAAALATAAAIFIAGRITRPLTELRLHATAVAAGFLDIAVHPADTRELGDLGRAFNAMTVELRDLVHEIDQARSRLEAVLASLVDGVVITNADGIVVRINDAAARLLGANGRDAVGRPFVAVCRDHELAGLLRAALASPGSRALTVEHGLEPRILDAVAQAIVGGSELLGLVVLRDMTELRRLETVRREFVANVSHELRTPLASIKAVVETLEAGAIDDPAVRMDFLGRIVHEVDRLAGFVNELLDLARIESGRVALRPEILAPAELLRRGVERLRPQIERARLNLEFDLPAGLPPVLADGPRIEQVLLNLVHNAIKFTPAGGTIVAAATATATSGMVQFMVRDTGVGVAEEELPRLFERFYKADKARRSDGTGLGLAIAKHIIQAHGGAIWVTSRPDQGSTFCFTLPIASPTGHANGDETPHRVTAGPASTGRS